MIATKEKRKNRFEIQYQIRLTKALAEKMNELEAISWPDVIRNFLEQKTEEFKKLGIK